MSHEADARELLSQDHAQTLVLVLLQIVPALFEQVPGSFAIFCSKTAVCAIKKQLFQDFLVHIEVFDVLAEALNCKMNRSHTMEIL